MQGFTRGESAGYVVDSLGNKFVSELSTKTLEKDAIDRMQHIGELSDGMNKADLLTLNIFRKKAAEQAQKIDEIYEEAIKYAKLKGTPEFDETKWLQYKVDFAEAKYKDRYPNMSWREELLTEAGKFFGFRFKKLVG